MAKDKNIFFRVDPVLVDLLENMYGSANFASSRITESLPFLRARSLDEIKGLFTEKEVLFLIDVASGNNFEARLSVQVSAIIQEVIDGNEHFQLATKWKIDLDSVVNRIKMLTSAQVYFLFDFCNIFWLRKDEWGGNAQEYVSRIL